MVLVSKNQINQVDQIEMSTIDQLVLQHHHVRRLEGAIYFSFIQRLVEPPYSTLG